MKSAFSSKLADSKIVVVDALDFDTMKTKNMVEFMKAIKVSDSALVVLGGKNENVEKASRNLPTVKTALVNTINVFDILKYDSFIMTPGSIRQWMRILEGHRDGFTLLVRCASGTRYENFHHDWAETMNELDYKYYREARRRGMADRELSREEMLVLSSAVWAMYFEPFYHDFTPEQIGRQAKLMHDFISWPRVLALKKPDHE